MSTLTPNPYPAMLPATWLLEPEDVPSIDHLITDDDTPVANIFVEKLLRLLVDVLFASWTAPQGQPYRAMTDVGLFFVPKNPAIVPDFMLAIGVPPSDLSDKHNRSYFVWVVGKVPDLVLEVVSDRRGGEDTTKMADYARMGIPFYVIFDPDDWLDGGELRAYGLNSGVYQPINPSWIPALGLGLTFWEGEYEGHTARWLRWCDRDGNVLLSGKERAESEHERAELEHKRADAAQRAKQHAEEQLQRLREQLRAAGIEPIE